MDIFLIAIVAGEPSGDQLGGALMAALKQRLPGVRFIGIGGDKMKQQGLSSLAPIDALTVCGYVEVLTRLPTLLRIRRLVKRTILQQKPTLYIGIDAPDFNIGLEKIFKKAGIPTVHYVGPSVWMWRKERIATIRQAVSHLLLILPFEAAIWQQANVPAKYVGHPLADLFPLDDQQQPARDQLRITSAKPVIALLPGSRFSEVTRLSAVLIDAAKQLQQRYPDALFLVPMVSKQSKDHFVSIQRQREATQLPIRLIHGHAHQVMQAADVVVLASGTATLEAALAKKPMVIVYKLNLLTYHLVKNKFYLPYFGLPNILSNQFIVPELLQQAATADNIVQAVTRFIDDPALGQTIRQHFTALHHTLRCNAAARAADVVMTVMQQAREDKHGSMRCR